MTDELVELEPLFGREDMFGQFFDGLVVELPEELLDDELDLVEELATSLTGETV